MTNLYLIYMTREELLESHIYCPEVIDDRIEAYLKMGFGVLLAHEDFILQYGEYAILFKIGSKGPDMVPEFSLTICTEFEKLQSLFEFPKIKLFRQDYLPVPQYVITPDDVDELMRKLKYENIRKTETTIQDIF